MTLKLKTLTLNKAVLQKTVDGGSFPVSSLGNTFGGPSVGAARLLCLSLSNNKISAL